MTDTPPTDIEATGPPADSWRRLALDVAEFFGDAIPPEWVPFLERADALLAAEDPHPPVFHVRPVRVPRVKPLAGDNVQAVAEVTEWRWVAIAANGRKLYGSTESYEHKAHAIAQAHLVADPLGAEVRAPTATSEETPTP